MDKVKLCDLHCHMLYGVDDGAVDPAQMHSMIDSAYQSGVRVICMTPHYNPAYFKTPMEATVRHFAAAAEYAKGEYPDLRLCLGNETYYYGSTVEDILGGRCLTLNKTRSVLVEFDPLTDSTSIRAGVSKLLTSGFHPVVAHVERYADIRRKTDNLCALTDLGARIQINASSVTGKHGLMTKAYVMSILSKGLVDVVADDCHNTTDKKVCLREAYNVIEKKFGADAARDLFWNTPMRILRGE